MQKTLVIIDGHAIIHRAYHALPPLTTKDGTQVNAVFGFASMLLKVINDLTPDYLAVSFDVAGKTFRDILYKEYKATRVKADDELYKQIPLVYELVRAFNIPIFEKEGFEADDVIGTVSKLVTRYLLRVTTIIVTGDMDMLQLVDDDVTEVYLLRKGMSDFQLYNEAAVTERFGFGPERIVDYKALRGDTSDNIPGVKGIGEKTAKQLIEQIGGIEEIYEDVQNTPPKAGAPWAQKLRNEFSASVMKKLEEGEKDARMSYELAAIRTDVPGLNFDLEKCETKDFDREKVVELFRKFSFYSLLKRIPGIEEDENMRTTKSTKVRNTKLKKERLIIVEEDHTEDFFAEMRRADVIGCKEILDGTDVLSSALKGFVFVTERASFFVELKKLNEKEQADIFRLFEDNKKTIVGHDLKQLVKALYAIPSTLHAQLFDIMIASYLLNSSTRAHDLRAIVLRELGEELPAGSDQGNLFGVDPNTVASELRLMRAVAKEYKKKLEKEADAGLFEKVEMALIPVLAEMELHGVAIDTAMLSRLSKDAVQTIETLQKKIWKEAGKEFNVSSSAQLRDILFDTLGLPAKDIKKGKTGYSTAASELEKLRGMHPIIDLIEEYREIEKLRNTYIDVLPTLIHKKTGRIHTTFNQAVTTTGRLSSSDPNLQNIPIRTELGKKVREAFVAEKGYTLISADYSQIELRIVASLAEDKKLMEIFEKGQDVHAATAAIINHVPLDKVTKEMRRAAKAVNFGILYGMGSFGLSSRTDMTQWEAKEFIERYFRAFSDVKKYLDITLAEAKKKGYVETLFGRRRYIPELKASNFQLRSAGERMAINMPVQGTAADLMKMAMIGVRNKIQERNKKQVRRFSRTPYPSVGETRNKNNEDIKMILQVHDELVFEVKEGLEDEVSELVKKEMEGVAKLRVPIEVVVHIGKRWGELK